MSPRRNWDSPNPSLASECASPPRTGGGGGGHTRLRVRGWGSIRNIVYAELDYKRLTSLHLLTSVEHSVSFICYVLSMYCTWRLLVRPESKSKIYQNSQNLAICLLCGLWSPLYRYLLHRVAEDFSLLVTMDPKPMQVRILFIVLLFYIFLSISLTLTYDKS
jgi:hypothetical protein